MEGAGTLPTFHPGCWSNGRNGINGYRAILAAKFIKHKVTVCQALCQTFSFIIFNTYDDPMY